ncbi:MAG: hypothetical protein AB2552_20050 [Candidatus Thiodiazotropha endolucinida]
MADYDFENPAFVTDEPGINDDYDLDLPGPVIEPPLDVQDQLNSSADHIQNLREELRQTAIEAQKKRLVDTFYKELSHAYGLRHEGRIDYEQFGIDADGKTLYWTPGDKRIPITATRGKYQFQALSSLARKYGEGGTNALRRSMGLTGYTSKTSRLSKAAVEKLQQADKVLGAGANDIETIELQDLPGVADSTIHGAKDVETALKTINDQPIDTKWVTQAARELAGLEKAVTGVRDEMANNLAKLSGVNDGISRVEKHLARERGKITETSDPEIQQEIRERIRRLDRELTDLKLQKDARLEALSANKAALRSQVSRIREMIGRLLHEDKTLVERIRTLFREQGITIVSILTAIGMAISTLVLALTGGGAIPAAPTPAPKPSDQGGLKEWVKKHLQALGRVLANLAGKAAAALPGIIGSIVSWLLSTLGKTASWLADNLWPMVIGAGALLLVAVRRGLSQ